MRREESIVVTTGKNESTMLKLELTNKKKERHDNLISTLGDREIQ